MISLSCSPGFPTTRPSRGIDNRDVPSSTQKYIYSTFLSPARGAAATEFEERRGPAKSSLGSCFFACLLACSFLSARLMLLYPSPRVSAESGATAEIRIDSDDAEVVWDGG
ncbi:uncharacterized protein LY89DRAFT_90855 [Mollisia scopiformis]|uniref:Uncharacterized protein n=1 Tax=Mollisia scopiformis TaxID=149040 RepID=A0A194X656_MOLSC|nr:uncharacterized protein LY89DRAFT_90855 [Mollisia scopiformis]KUJ15661.1 hypothetical protein LY89DRAFT_90855 [Mollisia scopiformis]